MLSETLKRAEGLIKLVSRTTPGVDAQAPKLIELLRAREQKGLESYGETLDTAEGYDWKQMIMEELGDGLMYLTKYAHEHDPGAILSEASMLVLLMATLQGGLRGNEEPDTVPDEDTRGKDGQGSSRIIISG